MTLVSTAFKSETVLTEINYSETYLRFQDQNVCPHPRLMFLDMLSFLPTHECFERILLSNEYDLRFQYTKCMFPEAETAEKLRG